MQQVKYSAAFNQHKRLSEQSHDEISKAMDLDEQNIERDKVIALYRMGINTMKSALKIQITSATERMIVDPTNVKLHRNIKATEERVSHLLSLDPQVSNVKRPTAKPVYRPTPRISRPTSAPKSNPTGGEKVDAELCKRILDDVLIKNTGVGWNDIVGLETAKDSLKEIVVYPRLRPELFTGLRSPAKGVLLFGPPGTGKTMLAKAVANEAKSTFFSISASSLTSKYVGEGEKLVRALFAMARELQPSIIFIDEIDSILSERSDSEHEASRRLKTEFLLQFDGLGSNSTDRLLVMGATNRPGDLDEAALRRLIKRIYIPLPEDATRSALILYLLRDQNHTLAGKDLDLLVRDTSGYSGSDLTAVCREASLGPIRRVKDLMKIEASKIPAITYADFKKALSVIRPSVSQGSLSMFEKWNTEHGTRGN